MSQPWLCQLFALTPATLNRYLLEGKTVLVRVVRRLPAARVRWPSATEMRRLAAMVSRAQPALEGCFDFVDGLNLRMRDLGDPDVQNAFYNGWLHCCVASSIFVFSPLGEVIYYFLNCPGWCGVYSELALECVGTN